MRLNGFNIGRFYVLFIEKHYTLEANIIANLTSLGDSLRALSNAAVNVDGQNDKSSNDVLPLYFTAYVCWMRAHN